MKGISIEDRFRGEFYKLNTHYTKLTARGSVAQDASEANHYFQGANSIRLEKQFKEWLLGSGGYFYSKQNADDSFSDRVFQNRCFRLLLVSDWNESRMSSTSLALPTSTTIKHTRFLRR